MDPAGILLAFGSALVTVGWVYRTPFPVQPMKAIGAAAITQSSQVAALTSSSVMGASIVTGLLWMLLALTGLAHRLVHIVPRPALLGIVMGLGFGFMLEGIRMMSHSPLVGAGLLTLTLVLLARSRFPAMVALLAVGAVIALLEEPALSADLVAIQISPRLPSFAWPTLSWNDLWVGALFLALPQLPLTFGNALISITEENNHLFPDRPVTEKQVAFSTGLLNLWSSALGGIPMCHGAGGMAGHVQFGARTGGASIMLGTVLLAVGLFLGDSVAVLFRLFPTTVLGVILFLAGVQLTLGSKETGHDKVDRFVILTTAAFAVINVGIAVLFGVLSYHASKRGWLKL